jgi:hypothetical protein
VPQHCGIDRRSERREMSKKMNLTLNSIVSAAKVRCTGDTKGLKYPELGKYEY